MPRKGEKMTEEQKKKLQEGRKAKKDKKMETKKKRAEALAIARQKQKEARDAAKIADGGGGMVDMMGRAIMEKDKKAKKSKNNNPKMKVDTEEALPPPDAIGFFGQGEVLREGSHTLPESEKLPNF
ncbi:unnamed protein product [Amoebophrya sp. A120]|nr:unnamed protein product [Amoebophrya sp. A120]|eukprot:GSA120T00016982001.1